MKPELWKKIDEMFAAAQAQPAEERAAFLDRACGGDQELRGEVESLLRARGSADSFLEHSPAVASADQPALKAGAKLAPSRLWSA
jgi:serine/threonine-protein kinase